MNNNYIETIVKLAKKAYINGDVPVGAIIVKNNKIIAKAYNRKEKNNDATAHAEIIALKKACKKLNNWHLNECTLYTTLEPCIMCIGAIAQARIKKVVYMSENRKFGFTNYFPGNKITNHKIEIEKIELDSKYEKMLIDFFKSKR